MFRKLRQWAADAEIRAFAKDLEQYLDKVQDVAHRGEGLQLRLERLANRVNMRLNRMAAPRDDDRDAEILDEIHRRSGNGARDPFEGGNWG